MCVCQGRAVGFWGRCRGIGFICKIGAALNGISLAVPCQTEDHDVVLRLPASEAESPRCDCLNDAIAPHLTSTSIAKCLGRTG